jgi:hypothetical protein
LVYIGRNIFLKCRSNKEIIQDLKLKNITISNNEIDYLAKKFIIYLSIIHSESYTQIKKYMSELGGYILHLDSTCEGDSPNLMTGMDEVSKIILHNIKIPSESEGNIIPFLKKIKEHFGMPLAIVSDMAKGILNAVKEIFPNILNFICHFHFLRDIGKDFFSKENDILRNKLRDYKIRSLLLKEGKKLKLIIDNYYGLDENLTIDLMNESILDKWNIEKIIAVTVYTLIQWCLYSKKECTGKGFPFDQPYLIFYQRIKSLYEETENLKKFVSISFINDNQSFAVITQLDKIIKDVDLKNTVEQMQEKITVFNKLREAMCITIDSKNNKGLNDEGQNTNVETIKNNVIDFRKMIIDNTQYSNNNDYKKMIKQIDNYWDKLFADPIVVSTKAGDKIIQPGRTNNVMEILFRDIKRSHRKKSGTNSMKKKLNVMLADTPLIKNLTNSEYLKMILNGKSTLEDRFAEIDIQKVRKKTKESEAELERLHPSIKKILKEKDLPDILLKIILKKVQKLKSNRILW